MIERRIYTILNAGIQWFQEDPRRLVRFFREEHGLTESEAEAIRTYFTRDPDAGQAGGPPTVIHSYPRQVGPFPCYAIVLSGDNAQGKFMGDDAGTALSYEGADDYEEPVRDLDGNEAQGLVHYVKYNFEIHCYVQHIPDVCLWYYHLLRFLIFRAVGSFHEAGYGNVEFGGRDLIPDARYMPENIWIRVLSLGMEADEVAYEAKGMGARMGGAFVADGVTSEGITKGITPSTS